VRTSSRASRCRREGSHATCLAIATLLVLPVNAGAQTPVTSLGLGYPLVPIDARAAALGGTGMGFLGGSFSSRNPADLSLFVAPSVGATLSPESADVKSSTGDQATARSRFVVVQSALPLQRWTFGLNINAETDLDWDVLIADTLESGFGDYPYLERRQHDGGISSVGVGLAYRFGRLAVGLEGSALTGSLRQVFRRDFEPAIDDPGNEILGALGESRWAFSGWRFRGGVTGHVGSRTTVSAAVTKYTQLSAEKDTFGIRIETRKFDMPVEVAVGGSSWLSDRFMLALAAGWRGWSATDFTVLDFQASDVFWAGGGLEYVGLKLASIPLPLRAGYRYTGLPFHAQEFAQLTETAFTFGIGAFIAGGRALLDFSVEFGSRGDLPNTGSEESFSRLSLSMGVSGL